MANSKQASKRARQAVKHRTNNQWQKSSMKTGIKRVYAAIAQKDLTQSNAEFQQTTSLIDRLAKKGIIHANKAARHKSRLHKCIKALEN